MLDEQLVERVSAIEHEQWAHWTRYYLNHDTPENRARWAAQVEIPYEALSDEEKASDRKWAHRVLYTVEGYEIAHGPMIYYEPLSKTALRYVKYALLGVLVGGSAAILINIFFG